MDFKKLFTEPLPKNEVSHAALLVIAGGYVLYLAYGMIQDTLNGVSEMSLTLSIVLAVVMGLAGLAVVIYGIRLWILAKKAQQAVEEETEDPQDEEENQV